MTRDKKLAVLAFAVASVETLHGHVRGDQDHLDEAALCGCTFGRTIRGLKAMQSETRMAMSNHAERKASQRI